VVLCYINAAFALLSLVIGGGLALILLVEAVAANGIANSRKWGYWLAVVGAAVYLVSQLIGLAFGLSLGSVLSLLFAGVLVVLLLHPMSRAYQRTWFR